MDCFDELVDIAHDNHRSNRSSEPTAAGHLTHSDIPLTFGTWQSCNPTRSLLSTPMGCASCGRRNGTLAEVPCITPCFCCIWAMGHGYQLRYVRMGCTHLEISTYELLLRLFYLLADWQTNITSPVSYPPDHINGGPVYISVLWKDSELGVEVGLVLITSLQRI